jgi:hypothetical protein
MGSIMTRKKTAVAADEGEWEIDDSGLDHECLDRTLVLRREPLPRKVQLMAAGVREIRCTCCVRVRPIAEAEEFGEGWICENCLSEALEKWKGAGEPGK